MIQPPIHWPAGPERPVLMPGEIHIWRTPLDNAARLAAAESVLSRDEAMKAGRFVYAQDRDRFIAAHGALRMVLASYLAADASALEFKVGVIGKPELVQTFTDLRFNLSHSGNLALIAVTRGRDVGVDLEMVQEDMAYEQIVEHYFDPAEVWSLRTAPQPARAARFFDLWTRKEACLKAEGCGLGAVPGIRQFVVRNLIPAEGYAGAIASEGDDWKLACWDWSL